MRLLEEMDADQRRKIERLYDAALECEPGDRPVFLQQACTDDEALSGSGAVNVAETLS